MPDSRDLNREKKGRIHARRIRPMSDCNEELEAGCTLRHFFGFLSVTFFFYYFYTPIQIFIAVKQVAMSPGSCYLCLA